MLEVTFWGHINLPFVNAQFFAAVVECRSPVLVMSRHS